MRSHMLPRGGVYLPMVMEVDHIVLYMCALFIYSPSPLCVEGVRAVMVC